MRDPSFGLGQVVACSVLRGALICTVLSVPLACKAVTSDEPSKTQPESRPDEDPLATACSAHALEVDSFLAVIERAIIADRTAGELGDRPTPQVFAMVSDEATDTRVRFGPLLSLVDHPAITTAELTKFLGVDVPANTRAIYLREGVASFQGVSDLDDPSFARAATSLWLDPTDVRAAYDTWIEAEARARTMPGVPIEVIGHQAFAVYQVVAAPQAVDELSPTQAREAAQRSLEQLSATYQVPAERLAEPNDYAFDVGDEALMPIVAAELDRQLLRRIVDRNRDLAHVLAVETGRERDLAALTRHRELARHPVDAPATAALYEIADVAPLLPARELTTTEDHGVALLGVPAEDAQRLWQVLMDAQVQTGYWPVFIGTSQSVRDREHIWAELADPSSARPGTLPADWYPAADPSEILRQADGLTLATVRERMRAWCGDPKPPSDPPPTEATRHDPTFTGTKDVRTNEWVPWVYLALVPVKENWMIPAYLPLYGTGESTPGPAMQVAIARHYQRTWDTRITVMHGAHFELLAGRRPTNADETAELMCEWDDFCVDSPGAGVFAPLWQWRWD